MPSRAWSDQDQQADIQQGNEASKKGEYERGLAHFNRAIRLNPKNAEAYFGRAYDYAALGVKRQDLAQLNLAIADYTTSLEINPLNVEAYNNRATAYVRTGEYDKAISDLNHSMGFGVAPSCFRNLGIAYAMKQDHEKAIQSFTQAIIINPRDAFSYFRRGCERAAQINTAAAVADFDQAIVLNPKTAIFFSSRGLAYQAEDEDDKAMADFNQALQLNPKDPQAYILRGAAFAQKSDYPAALVDFRQAIVLDPKGGVAHTRLGYTYGKMGDSGKYRKETELACKLDPHDPECANNLAWCLATSPQSGVSEGKEAVRYATGACMTTRWNTPALLDTLAAAYAQAGDFDAAIEWETKLMTYSGLTSDFIAGARKRLALYQAHLPCRDIN